jgi:hypothetical protein
MMMTMVVMKQARNTNAVKTPRAIIPPEGKKAIIDQRPVFLTTWFASRGELCFLGGIFTPSFTPRGEHSLLFRRMEGRTETSPQVINSPLGDKVHYGGLLHLLGSKFAPREKLRMVLRVLNVWRVRDPEAV